VSERGGKLHLLLGCTGLNWMRLALRYGRSVDRSHLDRVRRITLATAAGTPIRLAEALRYRRQITRQALRPPVFILGHWRSGTTNMHNLLLQDPQYGYVSLLHAVAQAYFLTAGDRFRKLLAHRLPATRPMDAVPVGLDEPMSEDFAMAPISDLTHYHGYFFPREADATFRRTVLFENVPPGVVERWGRTYVRMLKKVTLAHDGRRLVLKNPPNTGRIRQLVKLFPGAKFIHVARNPFVVYESTLKLMDRFHTTYALQDYDRQTVEEQILQRYRMLMERYFADRDLIPPGNLVEVRHEDVERDAVGVLEGIYRDLDLPGFENARPRLERYVASVSDYQKNVYDFSPLTVSRVRETLRFLLERWDYDLPTGG